MGTANDVGSVSGGALSIGVCIRCGLGPRSVLGAVFGDLGWSIPFDPRTGLQLAEARARFLGRGKMRREKYADGRVLSIKPAYRVISVVIVLEIFPIGQKLFHVECCRRRADLGRQETSEEFWHRINAAKHTSYDPARKLLRVITYENPFAWSRFPPELFCGPWDEHYGEADGHLQKLFAGAEIDRLNESLSLHEVDLDRREGSEGSRANA